MAEFSDVGEPCSFCGRQDFLPVLCNGCQKPFCQDHFRQADHGCEAASCPSKPADVHEASSAASRPALRCAAPSCREQLSVHNSVQCQTCGQNVCIRHRFEDQHPCVDLEAAVREVLSRARQELTSEDFAEAHRTMVKVFGNVLAEPRNEKFRSLRKANAVVKEKLKHPACTQALSLCGFVDDGECFVCPQSADLSNMRRVSVVLKANPPSASGTRIVNGVIHRPPKAEEPAAGTGRGGGYSAAPPAMPTRPLAPTAVNASKPSQGAKPKSAFDFQRRNDPKATQQAQEDALQELRRQQKERYTAAGAPSSASSSERTAQQPIAPRSSSSSAESAEKCVMQ